MRIAQAGEDFSGTWKPRCANNFGLLIEKADRASYAVIFLRAAGLLPVVDANHED
jgi:hypothetical protein